MTSRACWTRRASEERAAHHPAEHTDERDGHRLPVANDSAIVDPQVVHTLEIASGWTADTCVALPHISHRGGCWQGRALTAATVGRNRRLAAHLLLDRTYAHGSCAR